MKTKTQVEKPQKYKYILPLISLFLYCISFFVTKVMVDFLKEGNFAWLEISKGYFWILFLHELMLFCINIYQVMNAFSSLCLHSCGVEAYEIMIHLFPFSPLTFELWLLKFESVIEILKTLG